jgi:hypothetical protein
MLEQGAESVGDPTQCHAVAIDGRAPKFDGGIATRLDCVPFSVVVNRDGKRFYDEGEDVWPKRYAIWGRLVAAQPDQVAYSVIDSKSIELFMPSVFPPVVADTLEELGAKLGIDGSRLAATVAEFNAACRPGKFHPTELDGLATEGLTPQKTNWARPIDTPPYYGYSLRPGVTFTYLGLKVSDNAQVSGPDGPLGQRLGRGRDHGRLDPGPRLSGRLRHDHRNRLRTHRGTGGRCPCHRLSRIAEARRQVEICNACRYCEGYCAVFPAINRSGPSPTATSPSSPISATTAAAAITPASTHRRTSSR